MPSRLEPMERAAGADERFDALYRQYYPALYGLVFRLLGDHGESEDTLQEAFLKLAGATVLRRPDDDVAAWLRRVCFNLAANRLRTTRRALSGIVSNTTASSRAMSRRRMRRIEATSSGLRRSGGCCVCCRPRSR